MLFSRTLLPSELEMSQKVEKAGLKKKVAIITGATGQVGIYMTHFLLERQEKHNYEIHAVVRKNSAGLPYLIHFQQELEKQSRKSSLHLIFGDVTDSAFMQDAILSIGPHVIYNFAAQSQVQHSFKMP